MEFPAGLKYTKDHEWIHLSDKTATVGVTAYAVDQLGDIVHIDLPQPGESFAAGAAFGTIESTKTVSDLYMPVAGKVLEVNKEALASPEMLQQDSYQKGWLIKLELTGSDQSKLLDSKSYEKFVSEQD